MPASMPAGSAPWGADSTQPSWIGDAPSERPEWEAPDPAAVSGPPWPVLVASGPYTPPPFIRWPAAVGVGAFVVYLVLVVVTGNFSFHSMTVSHAAWIAKHRSTIELLNRDRAALLADASNGSTAAQSIADWRRFHDDAVAAAALPNPGGAATVPWREMLNDFANASSEVVQAVTTRNTKELKQALTNLQAGNRAASSFNQAMGVRAP